MKAKLTQGSLARVVKIDGPMRYYPSIRQMGNFIRVQGQEGFDEVFSVTGKVSAPMGAVRLGLSFQQAAILGEETLELHYSDAENREAGKLYVGTFPLEGLRPLMVKHLAPAVYGCYHSGQY